MFVVETSFYTKKQLKALNSLEAFSQMVSGFITSVSRQSNRRQVCRESKCSAFTAGVHNGENVKMY